MPVNCKKIPAPLLKDVTIFFINLANICWSWRRLQNVFSGKVVTRKTSWRHVLKTCLGDVLKTCLEDVLKACLEDVLRHVLKTCPEGVRRLGDKQNVYWEYLYLANLNLYLINLYLTYLYLTNQGESKMH